MNAPIDTLAFAEKFESAGFGQDQARVLAIAFAQASDTARADAITKADLDIRLSELEGRINRQLGDIEVRLKRHVGEVGKDVNGRLWSTVTLIAGVSTAISATVGAAVALLLKAGGI
jgi:hypothetical protein